jgi:DNA-binding NarL/FixJ family response regulator
MLPTPGRLRVLVVSDQVLVADTVQVALTSQGHEVVVIRWSNDARALPRRRPQPGGSRMDVGLLICELDRWSRLDVAVSIVARISVPWLALTSAPRGPAWGALLAAGVELVLPVETGLEPISDLLVSVGLRKRATPADERTELEAAWDETRSHHRMVVERVGMLSPPEREVLRLTYEGCSVAQIAEALGVASPTVRSWTRALLRKLEAPTELAAVATFRRSLDEFDTRVADRSYSRRPPANLVRQSDGCQLG